MSFSSMVINISIPPASFYESARSYVGVAIEKRVSLPKKGKSQLLYVRHISEGNVGLRIYTGCLGTSSNI